MKLSGRRVREIRIMSGLPSGLTLAIGEFLIPDNIGRKFIGWPEGYFWYKKFDDPPSGGYWDSEVLFHYDHAQTPTTIEELFPYVQVFFRQDDGNFYWKGDVLSEFPRYIQLSDEDITAWNRWLETEQQEWLNNLLEKCRKQSKNAQSR